MRNHPDGALGVHLSVCHACMEREDTEFQSAVAKIPISKRRHLCAHLLERIEDPLFMMLSESQNEERRGVAEAWRSSIIDEARQHLQRDDYETALHLLLKATCWWFVTEHEDRTNAQRKGERKALSDTMDRASNAITPLVSALGELSEFGFEVGGLIEQLDALRGQLDTMRSSKGPGRPALLETELARRLTEILVEAGFDGSSRTASQKTAATLAATLARHYDIELRPRTLEVYASKVKAVRRLRLNK